MAEKTDFVADQTNSGREIKYEPVKLNSPFRKSHKASNGSECTMESKRPGTVDSYAQKRKQPSNETELVSKKLRASIIYDENDSYSDDEACYMTILDVPKDLQIKRYLAECAVLGVVDEVINNKRQIQLSFENVGDRNKALKKLNDEGIERNIVCGKISGAETDFNDNASNTTEIILPRPWRPNEDAWETDPSGLYGLRPEFLKSLNITPPLDRWVHVTNFRCDKFELRDVMELAGHVLSCSVIKFNKRFAKVQYSHPLEAVQAVSMLDGQLYFGLKLKVFMEKNPKNDLILPKGLVNIGLGLGLQGRPVRDVVRQCQKYARRQHSAINPILFQKNIFKDEECTKDEDDLDTDHNDIDFNLFIAATKTASFINDRSFCVRHVEDLNSIDGESYEKDSTKRSSSRESYKSLDSNSEAKDAEKANKIQQSQPSSVPQAGQTIPLSIGQGMPVRNFLSPNIPQTTSVWPQGLTPPAFSAQPQFANRMFPGPHNRMPNPMPNPMSAQPRPFGPTQQFGPPIAGHGGPVPMHGAGPSGVGAMAGSIHRPGVVPGPGPGIHGPGPIRPPATKVMVQFANLPPSTTFPLLCEKLSHCGQVVSLQFTTPGCAVATFGHLSHADRCIQTYNGMTVEGYRIMATYM